MHEKCNSHHYITIMHKHGVFYCHQIECSVYYKGLSFIMDVNGLKMGGHWNFQYPFILHENSEFFAKKVKK